MRKKQKRETSSKKGACAKVSAWLETQYESNVVEENDHDNTIELPDNSAVDKAGDNKDETPDDHDNTQKISDNSAVDKDGDNKDEAPDDISWQKSKEEIVKEMKKQDETVLMAKQQAKETRRKRDEWLRQQKKEKEARQLSRLPDDVLKALAEKQEEYSATEEQQGQGKHISFDEKSDSELDAEEISGVEDSPSKQKGIEVTVLEIEGRHRKRISNDAAEFRHQHLYGDRLHRVSAVNRFTQKRKKTELEPAVKIAKNQETA